MSDGAEREVRPVAVSVPDALDVDLTFGVDGLHALRSTVAAHAGHVGAPESLVEALVIIAGELATNAVRHGGGFGRLRLWHGPEYGQDCVYVQVADNGPGIADLDVGQVRPDPRHEGGRGLWIVRSLSARVVIDRGSDGRGACVTAVVHRTKAPRRVG